MYVNLQQLLLLFSFCIKCGGQISRFKPRFCGMAVTIEYVCSLCTFRDRAATWFSGSIMNRQSLINVKTSCALIMSGIRFQSMQNFWNLMELPTLSRPTFDKHIKTWLFPVIYRMYSVYGQERGNMRPSEKTEGYERSALWRWSVRLPRLFCKVLHHHGLWDQRGCWLQRTSERTSDRRPGAPSVSTSMGRSSYRWEKIIWW